MTDKQDWAKEPWGLESGEPVDTNRRRIIQDDGTGYEWVEQKDWERIIACVNACAGVPTEALEAWGLTIKIISFHMAQDIEGYIVKLHVKYGATDIMPFIKEPPDADPAA